MKKRSCENCRYWDRLNSHMGLCRRFPPTDMDRGIGRYAATKVTDWCGEFKPGKGEELKGGS